MGMLVPRSRWAPQGVLAGRYRGTWVRRMVGRERGISAGLVGGLGAVVERVCGNFAEVGWDLRGRVERKSVEGEYICGSCSLESETVSRAMKLWLPAAQAPFVSPKYDSNRSLTLRFTPPPKPRSWFPGSDRKTRLPGIVGKMFKNRAYSRNQ